MIIEIPTPADFHQASINLINLAWSGIIECLRDIDVTDWAEIYESEDERAKAHDWYWQRVQPALANGLTLLQQSIEMALKGRIAAVSPFLLIAARDARDYPKGSDKADISFSAFRTIDASDLVRIHDTVCGDRLPTEFPAFWDQVRRQRNAIMHSVSTGRVEPEELIDDILTAYCLLYNGESWPKQRLIYRRADHHSVFPQSQDFAYGSVVIELGLVVERIKPAAAKKHFSFDKDARSYYCPHCYYVADQKWQREEVRKLAQLRPNKPSADSIYCFVCEKTMPVTRDACEEDECHSNVISDFESTASMCLVCTHYQTKTDEA